MEMEKIDLKKAMKNLFTARLNEFALIDVPALKFLKTDGYGDPTTASIYPRTIEWLYSTAYGAKFLAKSAMTRDFVVAPLEGLWWADDPDAFAARRKSEWHWTMMIMIPDFIDQAMFERAVARTRKKLGEPPASLRLEPYQEGLSIQTLHIGSYDAEGPVLARLHEEIIPGMGMAAAGAHHEIYLGDPRKVEAEKLR